MLIFIGDLHGDFHFLRAAHNRINFDAEPVTLIQVGDFGFYSRYLDNWIPPKHPIYAIDGNHEDFDFLKPYTSVKEVTEVRENLFYVPRGTVMELDGKTVGFMGGAESVDCVWRIAEEKSGGRKSWWPEETVTEDDIKKLWDVKLDLLVTHCPPISVIAAKFGLINHREWNLPLVWHDRSAENIEKLWNHHNRLPMVCGHMHEFTQHDNCTIVGINELYWDKPI